MPFSAARASSLKQTSRKWPNLGFHVGAQMRSLALARLFEFFERRAQSFKTACRSLALSISTSRT
jgi:hypothetical protein